ncbi:MAG TPA: helix-turn-helix domain-containing protein [Dehalococcoidia bacterium]|nr:helix-turn-helix domain-containing protein [Dehalococcoidia bacterium]
MGTYRQFCPIAKASEILAERWTFLIVRELLLGSRRFSELEWGLPAIPRSLLVHRLRTLESTGLLVRAQAANGKTREYRLTEAGNELAGVLEQLGTWGQRWANDEIRPQDTDPSLLMWNMRRRLNKHLLPPRRVVIQFDFEGAKRETYWLIVDRDDVEVCKTNPGFEPDLFVRADTWAMHAIWLGRLELRDAQRSGLIELVGPRELVTAFPDWLALSPFAHVPPARGAVTVTSNQ